jgi:poly(A) polymerase
MPTEPEPPDARAAARAIAQRLRGAGHVALFCGGAVRDKLLGKEPGDVDIATSATPEETAGLFPRSVRVGAQFGTGFVPAEPHDVQVTTFRADGLYIDGRRPTGVVFSDPATDAQRRDFTVNGLFEDPETGEVTDLVGGRQDLAARLIRAIGDPAARFREDHLRILRAVRFAVQLDFAIEPATFKAVVELAPLVTSVAAERMRVELLKTLRHGRGKALRLLHETGLLNLVLPEIEAMRGVTQPPQYHPEGDVFVHTALVLDGVDLGGVSAEDAEDLLMSALLHDVAKPPTRTVDPDGRIRFNGHDALGVEMGRAILERLKFPKRTFERVESLVGAHMTFPSLPQMRQAKLRRFLAQPDVELHMALHAADCGASHGDLSLLDFTRARLTELGQERKLPPPLLTGADLISLGYAPGPSMGEILGFVRDQQLDGALTDKDEAVRRVRERWPTPPRNP